MSHACRLTILSDFNVDVFAALCRNDVSEPRIAPRTGGLGQVVPVLLNKDDPLLTESAYTFVWTQPQTVSEVLRRAIAHEQVDHEAALAEVDQFCLAILTARANHKTTIFVPTWQLPSQCRGYGVLDLKPGLGVRWLLNKMNQRLADALGNESGVFVMDSSPWFSRPDAYDEKMWYAAKVPYTNAVFRSAVESTKAAIRAIQGEAKKLIICDLDDTLWGGIVGDAGWERLRLGGHDPVGEAFVDFQSELKALTRRGVALAIVSKNTESVALEAIESHPEMILRKEDFAGWRINWQDKAQNILELLAELQLVAQSAVFLDDNPVERSRVAQVIPEVLVVDLPKDKMQYPAILRGLNCFDTASITVEDRVRVALYAAERQRRELKVDVDASGSVDDWLKSLEMRVTAEPLSPSNQARVVQLLNKTNQMNLTTRRMTETEYVSWGNEQNHSVWAFRVSDKFGDAGLTGIASLAFEDDVATIADFILSCRVMGRKVEETMIFKLVEEARVHGASRIVATLLPTAKNQPCLSFWKNSGFEELEENVFTWDLNCDYRAHAAIEFETVCPVPS